MSQIAVINLLNKLEKKGLFAKSVNDKVQALLDYNTKSFGKIFLIFSVLIGASFIFGGIGLMFNEFWYKFPIHLRGTLSVFPALIALYIYFIAISKHKHNKIWIEGSSMFLMLMIGYSMFIFTDTYSIQNDGLNFIKVWLVLSLPLFYITKASFIAILYLLISCSFLFETGWVFFMPTINPNSEYLFFWIFFIGFLPHFLLSLDLSSKKQSLRAIFLGHLIVAITPLIVGFGIREGHLFWVTFVLLAYYLFGKKYYSGNLSFVARPFQSFALFMMGISLLNYSQDFIGEKIIESADPSRFSGFVTEGKIFYILGFVLMLFLALWVYKKKKLHSEWNRYLVHFTSLVLLSLAIYLLKENDIVNLDWFNAVIINLYLLGFAINAMIKGNRSKSILYMFFGLYFAFSLMAMRFTDMDYSWWVKGPFFIGVGGLFFLIYFLAREDYEES